VLRKLHLQFFQHRISNQSISIIILFLLVEKSHPSPQHQHFLKINLLSTKNGNLKGAKAGGLYKEINQIPPQINRSSPENH